MSLREALNPPPGRPDTLQSFAETAWKEAIEEMEQLEGKLHKTRARSWRRKREIKNLLKSNAVLKLQLVNEQARSDQLSYQIGLLNGELDRLHDIIRGESQWD